MTPSDIKSAIKAFVQATRNDVVSEQETAQRYRICKQCPAKVPATGMGQVSRLLGKIANENRVPKDIADYKCSVCGCAMMLLLAAKEPHVDSPQERKRREKVNKFCWMLKL